MMKMAVAWAVPVAAAILVAAPALAEDWDFILINNSGKGIKNIELAPAGTTTWQTYKLDPERKREPVTKAGAKMTVHFDKGDACKYDIKATFEDGSASTWSGVNLCVNSYVTVKYSGAGAPVFTAN